MMQSRASVILPRAGTSAVIKEMRAVQRISGLANLCGGYDVSLLENSRNRTSGCLGFFSINNDANRFSKHPIDRIMIRTSALSRPLTRDFSISARQEPPEPQGIPFFGTILSLIKAGGAEKLHEYVDKRHRELGPVYRDQLGPVRGVFINSTDEFRNVLLKLEGPMPEHFLPEAWILYNKIRSQRRGLLFMDGEEWLHFRRILNKIMLLPERMTLMSTPCQEAAETLINKWKNYSRLGVIIPNLEDQLYQWSLETMLANLMGSQWQNCKLQICSEIEHLALMLHKIFLYSSSLSILPAQLAMKFKLPVWNKFVQSADTILSMVHKLVPKMIQLNGDGLLSMMLNSGIGDEDAIRIVTDFIIAAGDTTAVTMQWTLLLLSSNPELQDKLFYDIRNLSLEEIVQHQLLKGVWREALRLHPVAPFLTRYLPADSTIGGYFVPKGNLAILSIYSSGHNESYFPQPSKFQPERWIRTKNGYQNVNNSFGSLPFAIGARSCIGRKLAEIQISLALAQIIKTFKIDCENRNNINMIIHLVSVPSESIKLKLTEREA